MCLCHVLSWEWPSEGGQEPISLLLCEESKASPQGTGHPAPVPAPGRTPVEAEGRLGLHHCICSPPMPLGQTCSLPVRGIRGSGIEALSARYFNNCTCLCFGAGFGAGLAAGSGMELGFLFLGTKLSSTVSLVK